MRAMPGEDRLALSLVFRFDPPGSSGSVPCSLRFGACFGERCEPVEHAFDLQLAPAS